MKILLTKFILTNDKAVNEKPHALRQVKIVLTHLRHRQLDFMNSKFDIYEIKIYQRIVT